MSRSVAAVIGITLGFPILAMIAISVASGVNPDFLMTFLVGGVVTAFLVGAIFEIKRVADLDSHHHSEQSGTLVGETLVAPEVHETAPLPPTVASEPEQSAAILLPVSSLTSVDKVKGAGAEPIVVDPVTEITVAPIGAKSSPKAGPRKRPKASLSVVPASEAAPTATKGKRKGGQRKPLNTV